MPYDYDLPAVFHRKNNCEWLVTMPLEYWIELYKESNCFPVSRLEQMQEIAEE